MFESFKSNHITNKLYDLMFLIDRLESKKYCKKSLNYFFYNVDSIDVHNEKSAYQIKTIYTINIDHIKYQFESNMLCKYCYIIVNDVVVCEIKHDDIRNCITWKHNKPFSMFALLKEHNKIFKQSRKKLKQYLKEYDDKKVLKDKENKILINSFKKEDL